MPHHAGQTAVIIPVPAADRAVSSWRQRFDNSAPFGVPAHVTVVFPFVPAHLLTELDSADLAAVFAAEPEFPLTLSGFGRFPGRHGSPEVLYLDPDPAEPFRGLTVAMSTRWPEAPPYGGEFADAIPHLTVTETAPAEAIAAARRSLAADLPITTRIGRGCMIIFDGARWQEHTSLPLGQAPS